VSKGKREREKKEREREARRRRRRFFLVRVHLTFERPERQKERAAEEKKR